MGKLGLTHRPFGTYTPYDPESKTMTATFRNKPIFTAKKQLYTIYFK